MPDYSKITEKLSHRVTLDYDTGARIVGYLGGCRPGNGQVQFITLNHVKLIDDSGAIVAEHDELTLSPNVLTSLSFEEGPSGRDV